MKLIFRTLKLILKFFFWSFVIINLLILIVPFLYNSKCNNNNELNKFDAIVVLGSPSKADCTPHIIMQTRVDKAIELFKKQKTKKIIFTGAAVQNVCAEADVMADYAISKGIPIDFIFRETQAKNTTENAYYVNKYIKENNFNKIAIVTSKPHVKRSCIVFGSYDFSYKMFPANYPKGISKSKKIFWFMGERMILTHHIIFGFPKTS